MTGRWITSRTMPWLAVLMLVGLLAGGVTPRASVVVPLTLPQLVDAAELIADGEVIAVHASDDRGHVERVVTVRVTEAWKGAATEVLHLRLAGGVLGRTRVVVPGVPEVQVGQRFVWFLTRDPRGARVVVGLHQGAWRVAMSPVDGTAVVSQALGAGAPGPVVRGARARSPRPLEALRDDVRVMVEKG